MPAPCPSRHRRSAHLGLRPRIVPPRLFGACALIALVGCAGPDSAETRPTDETAAPLSLREAVEEVIASSGAEVAVAMRSIDGEDELLIQVDEEFHAASTMKVPVMIELFRRDAAGELSLEDPLEITTTFASIIDGSSYELTADADSEGELYEAIGATRTLRELNEAMITWSSNLATNLLIEHLDAVRIRQTVDELGADGMLVLRGVEDLKAFEAGKSNRTTARALLTLFEKLGRGEVVSAEASEEMLAVLRRQQFNEAIPAGLPEGTMVAHKTGNITRIHHDAALVEGARPYALVVLVRGIDSTDESAALISQITSLVHQKVTG